jgi:hypothetical protein
MSLQLGTLVRNAILDAIEATVGAAPLLRIYSGSAPASPATAASGTLLAEATLPSDWMAAASGGTKSKSGTWEDTSANATGIAGYYRILDSTGTTTHLQGTVTATGGGGDMTVDNTNFAAGQDFVVNTYTLTAPNA